MGDTIDIPTTCPHCDATLDDKWVNITGDNLSGEWEFEARCPECGREITDIEFVSMPTQDRPGTLLASLDNAVENLKSQLWRVAMSEQFDIEYGRDEVAAFGCPDCGCAVVLELGDSAVGYGARCARCDTRMERFDRRGGIDAE